MKTLMMLVTAFPFVTSLSQDLPIIAFSVTHNEQYNQTTWQRAQYLMDGLIKYMQKNHEEKQEPINDKALKEVARTIEYVHALTKKDQSFQINLSTVDNQDIAADQPQGMSIRIVFEPDDGTNVDKIQQTLDELSKTYNENPETAFKGIQKTVKAIWDELGDDADIQVYLDNDPIE